MLHDRRGGQLDLHRRWQRPVSSPETDWSVPDTTTLRVTLTKLQRPKWRKWLKKDTLGTWATTEQPSAAGTGDDALTLSVVYHTHVFLHNLLLNKSDGSQ